MSFPQNHKSNWTTAFMIFLSDFDSKKAMIASSKAVAEPTRQKSTTF